MKKRLPKPSEEFNEILLDGCQNRRPFEWFQHELSGIDSEETLQAYKNMLRRNLKAAAERDGMNEEQIAELLDAIMPRYRTTAPQLSATFFAKVKTQAQEIQAQRQIEQKREHDASQKSGIGDKWNTGK